MSLRFFTNTKSGELMSRLNNDVVNAQTAISDTIVGIVTNAVKLIATLAVMFALEWRLTILGLMVFPLFIFSARAIGGKLRDIAREAMDNNAEMNAMMAETLNISGALLVKLFGRRDLEVDRFAQRAARVRDIGVKRAVIGSQFWALLGGASVIGTALVYWVGGHLVLGGVFTIGDLSPSPPIWVSFTARCSIWSTCRSNSRPRWSASSGSSRSSICRWKSRKSRTPCDLTTCRAAGLRGRDLPLQQDPTTGLLSEVQRHGRIENVRAVLSGSDDKPPMMTGTAMATAKPTQARELALEHVSFAIEPGQLAALVGPSGAGKTTMTYLIPRLYDPTDGRILLDGHDLRDVTLNSLTDAVGMVTQETYLFHDTILTNLLYARHGRDAGDRSKPPAAPPTSTTSSWGCPTATTRSSASAATG